MWAAVAATVPAAATEPAAVAATEAAQAVKRPAVAAIVSPSQLAEERVLGKLLQLTRDFRRPRQYIGYIASLCFCMSRACRAYFWEGGTSIDLLQSHLPWSIERCTNMCAGDGVCCCLVQPEDDGEVAMMPVSDRHP